MLKDKSNVNINCSKLARQYGCDRRTVSKAINAVKNNLPPPKANKPRKTDGFELIIEEKLKTVDTISKPLKETPKTLGNGELTLSYGKYSGAIKNGYPHGQGKLIYTKTRIINRHDMKSREATPGDYIIGEFYNGFVVYGKLYNSNGDLLSSLNFGVSNENNYDSK